MKWGNVWVLLWLWLVPALAAGLLFAYRRKRHLAKAFADRRLMPEILEGGGTRRSMAAQLIVILVFLFLLLALARPQWGFQWQEVKRQGLDIMIAIDTSRSMLADDVKPNRFERTKLAVKDLLKKLEGDRIGLIAFAGDAFLMCPLTSDYNGFLMALDDLDLNAIPRGGTSLTSAIEVALEGYANVPAKYKTLIMITDGENQEGDPIAAAQKAQAKGIKIYTVGIGTPEGELIRVPNAAGVMEFLRDNEGNVVKSRLKEDVLQQVASATGGAYVRASGAEFGVDWIYEQYLSQFEKREIESKMEKQYLDRFQIPLAIALILLMAATVMHKW